jgi:aspartate racemase
MKTIGIIGGLSWQSTMDYYRIINNRENQVFGDSTTGEVIVYSVNLEEMLPLVSTGEFEILGEKLGNVARKLEAAGADIIVLATNTMHVVADQISARISVPFLHIGDALAQEIKKAGFTKVGLIGTPGTMSLPFYKEKLGEYGITVITPPEKEYKIIFEIIHNELTFNIIKEESRQEYLRIMNELVQAGAQGIILGCTEIPMLIKQEHTAIPVFDTTSIHANAAVDLAGKN